jgi:hypothetical protein
MIVDVKHSAWTSLDETEETRVAGTRDHTSPTPNVDRDIGVNRCAARELSQAARV